MSEKLVCPNCGKQTVDPPALQDDWCDACLEEDRVVAMIQEEQREMNRLDESLRKRP